MERIRRAIPLALALGTLLTAGWLLADDDDEGDRLRALPSVTQPQWKAECGSCHMLYHPALLPERSWRRMMDGLADHFGENASLEPEGRAAITAFLAGNAADRSGTRRGAMLGRAVPPGETPLRITGTASFRAWHDDLRPATFRRAAVGSASNCVACHRGAEVGDFSERRVRIPR